MREKLEAFRALTTEADASYGSNFTRDGRSRSELYAELNRAEPTVRTILERLDGRLLEGFRSRGMSGYVAMTERVEQALGMLDDRDEVAANLHRGTAVNTLSIRTLGALVAAAIKPLSKEGLRTLLMASGLYDLDGFDPADLALQGSSGPPRGDILRPPLLAAHAQAADGDRNAHNALLEVARRAVDTLSRYPQYQDDLRALREALLSDGYEIRWSEPNLMPDRTQECEIVPIDPDGTPVTAEITALEAELNSRGYTETREHYRLAVKHFTEQDHPSANGQLRNMVESLVTHLAIDHTGYIDTGKAGQGGRAIKHLYTPGGLAPAEVGKPLPEKDGGGMLKGIWDILHSNGPHPGLSNADEARIRMQLCTALARFLLKQFPARS